jgi:hypothetical protein
MGKRRVRSEKEEAGEEKEEKAGRETSDWLRAD